jgi:glycosyltransferase involved in cell wall biosynthesis
VEDGETGFLIPSRCPGALAGRISQILTDRALRRCLSLNARELAQQYNWPNIVDQMAEAYSVLSEPAWGS